MTTIAEFIGLGHGVHRQVHSENKSYLPYRRDMKPPSILLWDFLPVDNRGIRPKNKKKKRKKQKQKNSYKATKHDMFDDFKIEAKPVFSKHAKDRLREGRQGKYITRTCKYSHNKKVVVTVLPHGRNHAIPFVHRNKKDNMTEKIKQLYLK